MQTDDPPKDFKGKQQDWNAIKELNNPEYQNLITKSYFRILEKYKDEINNLDDGKVFNLNNTNDHRPFDVGVDNDFSIYMWYGEWIKDDN